MGSVSDNERSRAASTFPAADMARTDPGRSQSHQQSRASSETLPGTTPSPQLNPKRAGFVSPQLFPNHSPAQAYSSLPLPPLHRGLSLGSPGAFTSAPHRGQEEGPGLARPSPRPHRGRSPPRGPGTPRPGSPLPPPHPRRGPAAPCPLTRSSAPGGAPRSCSAAAASPGYRSVPGPAPAEASGTAAAGPGCATPSPWAPTALPAAAPPRGPSAASGAQGCPLHCLTACAGLPAPLPDCLPACPPHGPPAHTPTPPVPFFFLFTPKRGFGPGPSAGERRQSRPE